MIVDKDIKDTLVNFLEQLKVSGIPDTPDFEKSIAIYRKVKNFVESLEVEKSEK